MVTDLAVSFLVAFGSQAGCCFDAVWLLDALHVFLSVFVLIPPCFWFHSSKFFLGSLPSLCAYHFDGISI